MMCFLDSNEVKSEVNSSFDLLHGIQVKGVTCLSNENSGVGAGVMDITLVADIFDEVSEKSI